MWLPTPLLVLLCILQLAACTEDFYNLLGIDKQASNRDIKSAYRRLSKKYHPDKNPGNTTAKQKFVEIAEAYEALSDPDSRKVYDQYGYEGLQQKKQGGGGGGHDPFDVFSRFFGGGGGFGQQQGQRRGPDMEVRVGVPLRDFYNGHTTEFQLEKQEICDKCDGSGSADGQVDTCGGCGGRGVKIQKHMLAPGIYQQVQVACDVCGGQGKTIKHKCTTCDGSRHVRKVNTFSLVVERGAPKGQRIKYENDADESPDYYAGDLWVTLVEKDPSLDEDNELKVDGTFFRRKGNDLYWNEVLSLREAWMGGWTRNLTHMDGHIVALNRPRGSVVQPGHIERVTGEGMPKWHEDGDSVYHTTEFGDLLVEYTIILPDEMEKGMEKDFWALWEKWRKKNGVDLQKDSGRPEGSVTAPAKDEL
ncbi:DnaJ protein-like protein [Amylocarpus encephaloides]|uniref:DnaJ protein-like protein n=1 Tax=Amylocarpus encephaloides TaxID=45428 RepID=A0A9P7YG53_9HELO|nr:DnaJ protein-like protein [Amylocarpus encephaloides]